MRSRRLAVAASCGTIALAGWLATELAGFGSPVTEDTEPADGRAAYAMADAQSVDTLKASAMGERAVPVESAMANTAVPVSPQTLPPQPAPLQVAATGTPDPVQSRADQAVTSVKTPAALPDAGPKLSPEPAPVQVATLGTSDPEQSDSWPGLSSVKAPEVSSVKAPEDCILSESCVDQYLWSLYERAPKVDTIKVREKVKVTIKKKGKTRTVTKTVTKLVDENFAWKDPKAAQRFGIPMVQYVIGGMDRSFKLKLYRACRAMDDAGLEPAITSAFRDNYRQALARGNKAAEDSSYHGGSRRGGYGHGLAADLVSVKGETRVERWRSSEALWKWIDARGKDFGVGRPYLDRDPPHVGPIDGPEYIAKRLRATVKQARLQTKKQARSETKKQARLETKKQARVETKKQIRVEAKKPVRVEAKKQIRVDTKKRPQPAAHGDNRVAKARSS